MEHLKNLEVRLHDRVVGQLAITHEGICVFEYAPDWLASGFSISPFELPLRAGLFTAKASPFNGGFGVFDDCLPDGWGRLIVDRYLQQKGVNPLQLNLLDRLALVGSSGRGALEFFPNNSIETLYDVVDFESLTNGIRAILKERDYTGQGISELYRRGGSPGGARPKIFLRFDGAEWLVKFRSKEDPSNVGKQELRYARLAQKAGVEMMECRLFEGKYFGTKRFDRMPSGRKIHVVSAAGLLCADFRLPSIDYLHLFQLAGELTHNTAELWKVYRLMCFNYLIGNKDDHAKNFAFLCDNGNWRFAPAFDLLPSDGIGGYHTTSFNDSISPQDEALLLLAERVGLNKKEAQWLLEEMRDIVSCSV